MEFFLLSMNIELCSVRFTVHFCEQQYSVDILGSRTGKRRTQNSRDVQEEYSTGVSDMQHYEKCWKPCWITRRMLHPSSQLQMCSVAKKRR